ncbi:flavoprotein [Actinoplanes sp. CA-030573]|uniref:flavoprotein n=1 Tax=Actinoplanes sp. CA-030573 TaxID=3239898 RepID=UPI003D8A7129
MTETSDEKRLCVIACGAGPAPEVGKLVALAQQRAWDVQIVATPAALSFLDLERLERLTGTPVRHDYGQRTKGPRTSDSQALIIAPATYNSINKLAAGINDTYALNVAAEAIGRGVRTAILPFVNSALAGRLPFRKSIESLRAEGVNILLGKDIWEPHPPETGSELIPKFPWKEALSAVAAG